MSRILITGVAGFLGSHLAECLRDAGYAVTGTAHRAGPRALEGITTVPCDIEHARQVEDAVTAARPDVVFHFAAQSLPAVSWRDPRTTFSVNVQGTLNLLEAVRGSGLDPLVVVAGSSAEYGPAPAGGPSIREDAEVWPSSPYGASKAAATLLARFYAQAYRMKVIVVRPFLAIGPGKTGDMCSDFARGIVAVERGTRTALPVGNLEGVRDFLDVRDVVRACWLIAGRGMPGQTYNICSGEGHAVREVLELLLARASRSIPIVRDRALARPADPGVLIGDGSRLRALGWRPAISIEESVAAVLDHWRERDAKAAGPVLLEMRP